MLDSKLENISTAERKSLCDSLQSADVLDWSLHDLCPQNSRLNILLKSPVKSPSPTEVYVYHGPFLVAVSWKGCDRLRGKLPRVSDFKTNLNLPEEHKNFHYWPSF